MKKMFLIFMVASITACNRGQNTGDTAATDTAAGSADTAVTTTSVDTSISNFISRAALTNAMEIESARVAEKKAANSEVKSYAAMMIIDHTKGLKKVQALADKNRIELPMMVNTISNGDEKYGSQSGSAEDVTTDESKLDRTGTTEAGSKGQSAKDNRSTAAAGGSTNTSGSAGATDPMYVSHQNELNKLKQRTGADFDREYLKMMVEDHQKAISLFQKAAGSSDAAVKAHAEQTLPVLKKHESDARTILSKLK